MRNHENPNQAGTAIPSFCHKSHMTMLLLDLLKLLQIDSDNKDKRNLSGTITFVVAMPLVPGQLEASWVKEYGVVS